MPINSMLISVVVVTMFVVFAGVLLRGANQSRSFPARACRQRSQAPQLFDRRMRLRPASALVAMLDLNQIVRGEIGIDGEIAILDPRERIVR